MAAAVDGESPLCLDQKQACVKDRELKRKQMALMEKLRTKQGSHHKSWTDSLMKSMRNMSAVDQKPQGDTTTERNQVQSCLYTLQRAMKGISQQSLVERLEVVARHQGLLLVTNGSEESGVTLKADMFHIEIILNKGGGVKEVKIAHQGDASICHELTDILSRGDFPEFTSHLEGLQSIYQVTEEKKLKPKIFLALQSLEKDLNDLAQFQNSISGVANYIHKSPLGILLPRSAGKPMKLIYFVSPYDLLDKKTLSAHPMTVEAITEHGLGRSVTVCLESGPANKLQTMPLMSVSKNLPSFNGLTHANSANLPACFVLVLPQPVPLALSLLHKIQTLTKLDTAKDMGSQPLLSLILDSNSGGKLKKEQQLFVSLPDQDHCYFIGGVSGGVLEEPGVMVSRIPFTHPTHVPKILMYLRQQLLFNSLLASCVRPAAKKDISSCLVFEMTMISLTQMMVVFEHPAHDTMVTVDMDLSDITNLKCHLLCSTSDISLCSDDYASRVLQRCLSLPILLRSLVRKGRSQLEKLMAEAQALAEEQARRAQEAALWMAAQLREQQARLPPSMPSKARPPPPQPPPAPPHQPLTPMYPPTPSPVPSNPPSVGDLPMIGGSVVDFLGTSPPAYSSVVGGMGVGDGQEKSGGGGPPLLVNLLDGGEQNSTAHGGTPHGQASGSMSVNESPMLSKLLEDNISVATNVTPMSAPMGPLQQPPPPPPPPKVKGAKGRKRRSQSDAYTGRSPKHRVTDTDSGLERFGSLDFESSSSSPFESSMGGPGGMPMYHHHHQMMPSQPSRPSSHGHMGSVIDLTEDNMPESSLKKLVNFSNFIPAQEHMRVGNSTPDSDLHALLNEQELSNSPSAGLKPNQMTGSKNENASTSPEGFLIGSGGVGKASVVDPGAVHPRVRTDGHSSSHSAMVSFLGHGQATRASPRGHPDLGGFPRPSSGGLQHRLLNCSASRHQVPCDANVHKATASPFPMTTNPSPKVVSSSSMTETSDLKSSSHIWKRACEMDTADSSDRGAADRQGQFKKVNSMGHTVPPSHHIITSSSVCSASLVEGGNPVAPKVRLKLQPFQSPFVKSQSLDTGMVQSPSSAGSKSSSSNTFDFCSDEDEDDAVPKHSPSEHFSVYASSPTRLQISSRGRPSNVLPVPDNTLYVKPEKYKRRDKSSGNTKHRKGRSDSKKQKKRKKHDPDFYPPGRQTLYRASTIEGDCKTGTKLKIRVSKQPIMTSSPIKERYHVDMHAEKAAKFSERVSNVLRASPVVEKLVLQRQDRSSINIANHGSKVHGVRPVYQPASGKSSLKSNTNGMVDFSDSTSRFQEADPKLAKATICLEPLNLNSALSSSVCLSEQKALTRVPSVSMFTSVSTPTSATVSVLNSLPHGLTGDSVTSPSVPEISDEASGTSDCDVDLSSSSNRSSSVFNEGGGTSTVNSDCYNLLTHVKKTSGIVSLAGSRPGARPCASDSLDAKAQSVSLRTQHRGTLRSPVLSEHQSAGNISQQHSILKNSGKLSQKCATSQKTDVVNQGMYKNADRSGHHHGVYNGDLSSPSRTEDPFFDEVTMSSRSHFASEDGRYNGMVHRSRDGWKQTGRWDDEKSTSIPSKTEHFQLDSPSSHLTEHETDHKKLNMNRPSDLHKKHLQVNKLSELGDTTLANLSPQCPKTSSSEFLWSPVSDNQVPCLSMKSQNTGSKNAGSPPESVADRAVSGCSFSDEQLALQTVKQHSQLSAGQRDGVASSVVPVSSSVTGSLSKPPAVLLSTQLSTSAPAPGSQHPVCAASQNYNQENNSSSSRNLGQPGSAQRTGSSLAASTAFSGAPPSPSQPGPAAPHLDPETEADQRDGCSQSQASADDPQHQGSGNWAAREPDSPGLEASTSTVRSASPRKQGSRSDQLSPDAHIRSIAQDPLSPECDTRQDESKVLGQKLHTFSDVAASSQQNLGHDSDALLKCPVKRHHEGSVSLLSKQAYEGSIKNPCEVSANSSRSGISDNNDTDSILKQLTHTCFESAFSSITSSESVAADSSKQTGVKVKKDEDSLSPGSTQSHDVSCLSQASCTETPSAEDTSNYSKKNQILEAVKNQEVERKRLDCKTGLFCATSVKDPVSPCDYSSEVVQSKGATAGTSSTITSLQTHKNDSPSSVSAISAKGTAQNEMAMKRPVLGVSQAQMKYVPLCTSPSVSSQSVTTALSPSVPSTTASASPPACAEHSVDSCVHGHQSSVPSPQDSQASTMTTSASGCGLLHTSSAGSDGHFHKEGDPVPAEEKQSAASEELASVSGTLSHDVELTAQLQDSSVAGSVTTPVLSPVQATQESSSQSGSHAFTVKKPGLNLGQAEKDLGVFGSKLSSDSPLEPPAPELDSAARASPKESSSARCGSPAVGSVKMFSGKKFNGEFGRDRPRAGKDSLMVGAPRSPLIEQIGHNNTISGHGDAHCTTVTQKGFADRQGPASAAGSLCDPSNPENKLGVDHGENCGGDAQSSSSSSSPLTTSRPVVSTSITSVFPTVKRVGELSGKTLSVGKRSPSQNACGKSTFRPTSHLRLSPTHAHSSPGRNSCDMDNDLMDATLVSFSAS